MHINRKIDKQITLLSIKGHILKKNNRYMQQNGKSKKMWSEKIHLQLHISFNVTFKNS